MTDYDRLWDIIIDYDRLWQIMTDYDKLWQIMPNYDRLWQIMINLIQFAACSSLSLCLVFFFFPPLFCPFSFLSLCLVLFKLIINDINYNETKTSLTDSLTDSLMDSLTDSQAQWWAHLQTVSLENFSFSLNQLLWLSRTFWYILEHSQTF